MAKIGVAIDKVEHQYLSEADLFIESIGDISQDLSKYIDSDHVENEKLKQEVSRLEEIISVDLPGPNFEISKNGKLKLSRSGNPSSEEIQRFSSIRSVLIEAVEDLIDLSVGSNSHSNIAKLASSYRRALGDTAEDLSIDLTYAYGVRLTNSQAEIAKRIESGDYQQGSQEVEEAIRSVSELHRTIIMDTLRGRELASHVPDYDSPTDTDAKREALTEIAETVESDGLLLERKDARAVVEIIEEFEKGPNPARSNQVALLTISNMLGRFAKPVLWTAGVAATGVVGNAAWTGVVNGYQVSTLFLQNAEAFFLINAPTLIKLAMLIGGDIGWLPSFIDWLKKNKDERI
ncbi:hypothetical protein E2A64_10470 [Pseudohoeflea suaedae]|uniref:Uncharacterized protein n=1 Tax=Pseudohoeflea suaedae TaxID=877384 RepID=A0A4R5PJC1_9HYPH|nr:hypothetical protein [Pseudohoeflea suaedae]TDH35749.1 hypothetical protein E2A64_10470 [Pseudohoeflea suaedae]